MTAPVYSVDDFLAGLQGLMPRGPIWQSDPNSVQGKLERGLVTSWARLNGVDAQLLADAFPATAEFLLPEWEAALGLPDPCAGAAPTIDERRQQVVARLTDKGGLSSARFISLAAALGYSVSTTMFAPFRAGQSHAGDPLGGPWSFFTWRVNAPYQSISYFRAGSGHAGDPLESWGNNVLECEIDARAPAYTDPMFAYGFDLHEGIGVHFDTGLNWVRPIGDVPTISANFTSIFTFTRASSATYLGSDGILHSAANDVPRIEYDADGALMGLLIEGTPATNLLLQSENLGATWLVSGTTSLNAIAAPDGNVTGDKFIEQAAGAGLVRQFVSQTIAKAAVATQYTVAEFFKAAERTFGNIRVSDGPQAGDARVSVDLSTGTISAPITNGVGFTVQDSKLRKYPGGWYRLSLTFTSSADTTLRIEFGSDIDNNPAALAYTGDGVSGLYMWGGSCQTGPGATSYTPTTTVAVTRALDKCQRNVAGEYSQITGTYAIRYKTLRSSPATGLNQFLIDARNPVSSNSVTLFHSTSGTLNMSMNSGGGFGGLAFTGAPPGDMVDVKAAGAFALNDVAVARDGVAGTPDASAPLPTDVISQLNIGNSSDTTQPCIAVWIKSFDLYPTRLSNSDLLALTA